MADACLDKGEGEAWGTVLVLFWKHGRIYQTAAKDFSTPDMMLKKVGRQVGFKSSRPVIHAGGSVKCRSWLSF